MNALFQQLSDQDIPILVGLMRDFYAPQHMRFDDKSAAKASKELLAALDRGKSTWDTMHLTRWFSVPGRGRRIVNPNPPD
jgi:hypothetical protein